MVLDRLFQVNFYFFQQEQISYFYNHKYFCKRCTGVESILEEVQIEGTFPDGSKLVTIHFPVCTENGDLGLCLYGSCLPVPPVDLFKDHPEEGLVPGKILAAPGKSPYARFLNPLELRFFQPYFLIRVHHFEFGPASEDTSGSQHGRPACADRIALSFRRGQPAAALRPVPLARHATEHPCRLFNQVT